MFVYQRVGSIIKFPFKTVELTRPEKDVRRHCPHSDSAANSALPLGDFREILGSSSGKIHHYLLVLNIVNGWEWGLLG